MKFPARGRIVRALAALGAIGLAGFVLIVSLVASGVLIDRARFAHPDDALLVVDRAGATLRHARTAGADRRWTPLAELPPQLVHAVIAAEDGGFYQHNGVDFRAVFRSALRNLLPWTRRSGASTITQQLVKRVYGRTPGLWGKSVEALRALSLERVMSKDEILEQYVNRLPFGDGIEGVARACEEYFGRSCTAISPAEAALLAGIPRAPSATEPRRHRAASLARREVVLTRMEACGYLSAAEHALASREVPSVLDVPARPYEAPRFVDAVLREREQRHEGSAQGRVVTSLDLALQRRVENTLGGTLSRWIDRGARNAAAVVVANSTGEVLAYAGAARQGEGSAGGAMDLLRARRQPGSALKPFAYELWFERGGTAATILDDTTSAMTGAGGAAFVARDYDGTERGPVRARVALASSLNLAALDVARRVGTDALVSRLHDLGFALPRDAGSYGGALVLGDGAVSALELARAYATLARGGTMPALSLRPTGIVAGERVMHPDAARVAWDVLTDASTRRLAFGDDLRALAGERDFALKTGTSSGWRDAWAVVADARVTVVVWIGDPRGEAMSEVSGFQAAAPAAARILGDATEAAARDGIAAAVPPPVALIELAVCPWSGLRAGPHCTHAVIERFVPGTAPNAHCDAHDGAGHDTVPPRYAAWLARTHPPGIVLATRDARDERIAMADTTVPVIRDPRSGARWLLRADESVSVPLRATRGGREIEATWEMDGVAIPAGAMPATPGTHTLVASYAGRRSDPVQVTVETIAAR